MIDLRGTKHSPIVVMDDVHSHTFDGNVYEVTAGGVLNKNDSMVLVGVTGDKIVHFHKFNIDIDAPPVTMELLEDATIVTVGSTMAGVNRNRLSSNIATLTVTAGGTVSGGTLLTTSVYQGSALGSHTQTGDASFNGGWLLKPNSVYAIRVTAGEDVNWSGMFAWYELDY